MTYTLHHGDCLEMMRDIVRASSRAGGVVMDAFMGGGSAGHAAALEGRNFIGIELSAEYLSIARGRIEHHQTQSMQLGLL